MKKAGIIKKTKAVIDYKDVGMPICALLFINIEEAGDINASGIMDDLKSILTSRESLYDKADGQIMTSDKSIDETLDEAIRLATNFEAA